jgi:hypothetical protein
VYPIFKQSTAVVNNAPYWNEVNAPPFMCLTFLKVELKFVYHKYTLNVIGIKSIHTLLLFIAIINAAYREKQIDC